MFFGKKLMSKRVQSSQASSSRVPHELKKLLVPADGEVRLGEPADILSGQLPQEFT